MKKRLILLLYLLCSNYVAAQEKIIDILDNLSIYNKEINTKIADSYVADNYFDLMQEKLNFEFKRGGIDKLFVYINGNDEFSVYQMFHPETFNNKMEFPDMEYKYILFFDNKALKCYLIKYYPSNTKSFSTYTNIEKNLSTLSVNLTGKITYIIELDNNLDPLSAIKFMIIPPSPYKIGDIAGLYIYKIFDNQIVAKQITLTNNLNIYNVTYEDLKIIFFEAKQNCFKAINSQERPVDIKKLYIYLESGGW